MSDDRYAPPASIVSDIEPAGPAVRPRVVVRAVWLLWISFFIGLPASLIEALEPAEDVPLVVMLVITAIFWAIELGLTWWLATAAWRGRAWSRWVQAILFVLGMAFVYYMQTKFPEEMASAWYVEAMYFAQWLLNAFAIGMLFAPSANAWYRTMKALR
jgi:hypothetical protein